MKIGIAVLAIIVVVIVHAAAQDPPADVVKISTNLIQLDATVTDSKGNVIRDLTRDDFEIYENGRKQSVSGFSFVSHAATKTVATAPSGQTVGGPRFRRSKCVPIVCDARSHSWSTISRSRTRA
jgi:hypothetical protein